jgi:hypothetical protein
MMIVHFYKIPVAVSLGVIFSILVLSVGVSLIILKRDGVKIDGEAEVIP